MRDEEHGVVRHRLEHEPLHRAVVRDHERNFRVVVGGRCRALERVLRGTHEDGGVGGERVERGFVPNTRVELEHGGVGGAEQWIAASLEINHGVPDVSLVYHELARHGAHDD